MRELYEGRIRLWPIDIASCMLVEQGGVEDGWVYVEGRARRVRGCSPQMHEAHQRLGITKRMRQCGSNGVAAACKGGDLDTHRWQPGRLSEVVQCELAVGDEGRLRKGSGLANPNIRDGGILLDCNRQDTVDSATMCSFFPSDSWIRLCPMHQLETAEAGGMAGTFTESRPLQLPCPLRVRVESGYERCSKSGNDSVGD